MAAARIWILTALVAATLAVPGCGKQTEQTPQRAYEEFFAVSHALTREPQESLQEALWELIAPASRDALEARAVTLNESLPEGARVAPYRLLVGREAPLGSRIDHIDVVDQTEREATLHVVFDGGEATVKMLRDGDQWTVALPPLPSS